MISTASFKPTYLNSFLYLTYTSPFFSSSPFSYSTKLFLHLTTNPNFSVLLFQSSPYIDLNTSFFSPINPNFSILLFQTIPHIQPNSSFLHLTINPNFSVLLFQSSHIQLSSYFSQIQTSTTFFFSIQNYILS